MGKEKPATNLTIMEQTLEYAYMNGIEVKLVTANSAKISGYVEAYDDSAVLLNDETGTSRLASVVSRDKIVSIILGYSNIQGLVKVLDPSQESSIPSSQLNS